MAELFELYFLHVFVTFADVSIAELTSRAQLRQVRSLLRLISICSYGATCSSSARPRHSIRRSSCDDASQPLHGACDSLKLLNMPRKLVHEHALHS